MERPTPKPTGTEVLLKVIAAGVCHSDLHFWDGFFDLGGGKHLKLTDRGMKLPLTIGHENVGAGGRARPGSERRQGRRQASGQSLDRLRRMRGLQARRGASLHQAEHLGVFRPGGYADHMIVPHPRYLFDIGTQTRARRAARLLGRHRLQRAEESRPTLKTEPVVIIGAGGLGLMCLAIHKAMGGKSAIVVDIDPVKREAAKKAGATRDRRRQCAGRGAQIKAATKGGAWAVIDLVGSSAPRSSASTA